MFNNFICNNISINYSDTGNGKLVFLIHGFGEDSSIWKYQEAFLEPNYRLIIPDLPGSGATPIFFKNNITIDDYADLIYALYLSLKLDLNEKISILGHSMGGYISLAFAKKYSSILKSIGLIHSTAFADSDEKKQIRLRGIEIMADYGATAFLKNTIPNLFAASYKQQYPEVVKNLILKSNQFTRAALQQYYKAIMNREDYSNILKLIKIPVLFIIGKEDVAVQMQDVLQQVHLPQITEVIILENVGHMGMLEATHTVNIAIGSFLENF